jgi:hypothetical protein
MMRFEMCQPGAAQKIEVTVDIMSEHRATSSRNARATSSESAELAYGHNAVLTI